MRDRALRDDGQAVASDEAGDTVVPCAARGPSIGPRHHSARAAKPGEMVRYVLPAEIEPLALVPRLA
jgi:hypothetical protein